MMRRHLAAGLAGVFVAMSMGHWSEAGDANGRRYPEAPRSDTVDDYHGTKVADPYRWLEDPDSPETRAWVEAENKVTFAFLEAIPARDAIKKRLTELWNYEKFGVPFQRGRPLLLHPQQRPPEPERPLHVADRSTPSPRCCSTRTRSRPTAPSP